MKIAWCSCNHPVVQPYQVGWMAVAAVRPDLLLLLGDNVYLEDGAHELIGPWKPATHLSDGAFARRLHERYERQFAVPEFRVALAHSARVAGTVDDHDFLGNDFYVSPVTATKARIARLLHRQFIEACNQRPLPDAYPPMPSWGSHADEGMDQGLGLATSITLDDVRVIILDSRSMRTRPGPDGTVLGSAQLSWLAQELVASQAVTIVASSSPLTRGTKPGIPGSAMDDYPRDARVLRSLYRGRPQQVVLHLGGDLHYNELWPDDEQHQGFVEVASSGMGTGWLPFWPVTNKNFGLVEVGPDAVRVRTFGREAARNFDREIPRPGLRARSSAWAAARAARAAMPPRRPDPAALRTGDVIWPRADDQAVVYRVDDVSAEELLWQQRRDAFVTEVRTDAAAPAGVRELAQRVSQWTYDDYLSFPPQARIVDAYSRRVWVGHVGLIELRDGQPWVIDAMPRTGVAASSYADWLASRPRANVWHGRLRELSDAQRQAVVHGAREVEGKPYQFFNFDLADPSGFYCSKLIWFAVWRALGLSLDGQGPNRRFWFSPWQAMRSPRMDLLFEPGDYGAMVNPQPGTKTPDSTQ